MEGCYEQKDSPATQLGMAVVQLIRIQRAVWVTAKLLSSVPGLPEGIVLLLSCAVASAIPLLWSSLVSGEAPHFSSQKASLGTLVFLISVALSGNLAVMVLTPVLERVWNLVGFTAQAAAVGEEIATPLLAIYICIVGPVLEELIYRGVVLRRLLPGGARQAILLSALCFGLMHHDLYQGLSAFWCGLIFGYAALHYGLGTSIGLHIAGTALLWRCRYCARRALLVPWLPWLWCLSRW